jgi:hypothetical protein
MATGSFTTSAWVVGGRVRHDINHDHYGDLSTLGVVLEERLGSQEAYTPLHDVLDYLVQRMIKLESSNHFATGFQMDAYILAPGQTIDLGGGNIQGVYDAHAVLQDSTIEWTGLTVDALFALSFSMDAVIRALEEITVDAVIV